MVFHIVETNQPGLLGFKASQELGLIKVVMTTKQHNSGSGKHTMTTKDLRAELTRKYVKVFTGFGRLERPYHIRVDPKVKPVVSPPRSIPAALRDRVKTELEDMQRRDVIRKVEQSTDWVNSMAIVEKPNGKFRICLDPQHLNKTIKCEYFQLPTIENITTRMTNAKWFSKLDANQGYWQIPLDEESQQHHLGDTAISAPHLESPQPKKSSRKE